MRQSRPLRRASRHPAPGWVPFRGPSAGPVAECPGDPMRMVAPINARPPRARVPIGGRASQPAARALTVEGVVQGVGFRPFVWRLATELGLAVRVRNAAGRVEIEAAGTTAALGAFARRLRTDAPPRARVERVTALPLGPRAAAVACPRWGPRRAYRRTDAPAPSAHDEAALAAATADLRAGRIVAVKGLGGYHLACDATNATAVGRLRDRKRRWAKPFAVMVRDLAAARALCHVTATEAALLAGPARPIVLLVARRRGTQALAPSVAAGNRRLGIFLPYTPLHHLLLEAVGRPLVLTSGNLTDEPLATDDADASARLAGLADAFLTHDREIRARYDDSVTGVVAGRESLVRRARGHAPEALPLPIAAPRPILAVGAELKHTFTLARGGRAHVAPHNGDLEDLATHRAFTDGLAHLSRLLALEPEVVAHDRHPEYLSTKYALAKFPPERRIAVQHHHAHVASCAAEHGITTRFLGVAYDGLGMGDDGTLWGGELFVADLVGYRRVARFARAPLPGGALAVKRPYRMALGYLLGAEALGAADGAGVAEARGPGDDLAT